VEDDTAVMNSFIRLSGTLYCGAGRTTPEESTRYGDMPAGKIGLL